MVQREATSVCEGANLEQVPLPLPTLPSLSPGEPGLAYEETQAWHCCVILEQHTEPRLTMLASFCQLDTLESSGNGKPHLRRCFFSLLWGQ